MPALRHASQTPAEPGTHCKFPTSSESSVRTASCCGAQLWGRSDVSCWLAFQRRREMAHGRVQVADCFHTLADTFYKCVPCPRRLSSGNGQISVKGNAVGL